jgi:tRNA threonylcarbamoyladenosine biosynthesis protein TsaB
VKLLALETATECCSVTLWLEGAVRSRQARAERGHGEHVLRMIDELLAEGAMTLQGLDLIAFGAGPGAFTGVRLAASITQGLAYAAALPVLPVSTLRASAQQALWPPAAEDAGAAMQVVRVSPDALVAPERVLVCQDARMGEVYWALFRREAGVAVAEGAEALAPPGAVLARLRSLDPGQALSGAGSGFAMHAELAAALAGRQAAVLPGLMPHAREIAVLAAHAGVAAVLPPAAAQPVYLRNDVAAIPATRSSGAR